MLKIFISLLFVLQIVNAQVLERKPVPAEVVNDAREAVKVLCTEILRKNYNYGFETLYPRTKKTLSLAVGGEEELKKVFDNVPKTMKEQGIDIIDIKVGEASKSFRVRAAHLLDSSKPPVFTEYMVIIPTTKTLRVIDSSTGLIKRANSFGYQIAVRHIDGETWTFIDGSRLSLRQLRDLFPHLPEDVKKLGIPKVGIQEIK